MNHGLVPQYESCKNMNTLIEALETKTNITNTENGALTHLTTFSSVLDFFGKGGALRKQSEADIIRLFSKAFAEDKLLALKCLFYLRDARHGQGERRTFKVIIKWLAEHYPDILSINLDVVPEFGRWDDLFVLEDTKVWGDVLAIINNEFNKLIQNHTPSLFAKWCPSINTSSKKTTTLAKKICRHIGLPEKKYRKILSKARSELKVVEQDMCANNWKEIDYTRVPSRASLLYKDAFKRHDTARYCEFIKDVKTGKTKINASVTYPYEIVEEILYRNNDSETLDVIWDSLPNYANKKQHKGIVVADVSGSMTGRPMAVSISLAMYFAEKNNGPFKNSFITFSQTPTLQKIVGNNIREKIVNLSTADWSMSTNLQAVFDLILETAIEQNITQDDMPDTLYIVSDMEFDAACEDNKKTNFDIICQKYKDFNYIRPDIVFWNVDARTNQVPITKNSDGVCLVSGCSPVILKTLLANEEISAIDVMLDTINAPRYSCILV